MAARPSSEPPKTPSDLPKSSQALSLSTDLTVFVSFFMPSITSPFVTLP